MKTEFLHKSTILCGVLVAFFVFQCEEVDPSQILEEQTTVAEAQQKLQKIQVEIDRIVLDKRCEGGKSCKIKAYGAKACGGPSRYVIYGSKIEEDLLVFKCNQYTRLEEEINEKFGIISDCSLLVLPEITCENGQCVEVND